VLDRVCDPVELHRQRVCYVFDHLAESFGHDAPLFVFAHILCPHPPFVFDVNGAPVHRSTAKPGVIFDDDVEAATPAERVAVVSGYRGQVQYVNRRIQRAIDAILADSSRPKIIVVQGDHGSNMTLDSTNPSGAALKERMSILNAYYVPAEIRTRLYPSITPVNTFRIILGQYFADVEGPLADESYFSKWNSPYDFVPVSGTISKTERY
jgi:arylsulfatase A-like enzyme